MGEPQAREYELAGRTELAVYAAAVATYIPLGAWLRTPLLNWIVGPGWFVAFAWAGARLLGRRVR